MPQKSEYSVKLKRSYAYARTMPAEYRVELQMNDSVAKVIRPAAGWNPPTLRFHFVDSAPTLAESVGR